jgi:hypothetical protein
VYLVLPLEKSSVNTFDLFHEECYWSKLDESPSGTPENYRGALRDINGNSPNVQKTMKIVQT